MLSNIRITPDRSDRAGWLAFGVWAVLLGAVSIIVLLQPDSPSLNALWRNTGRAWTHGEDLYENSGYRYGPLIAAALSLLANIPLGVGAALVRLVNAAVLLGATLCWMKQAAPEKFDARSRAAFLILLAALSLSNLHTGQFNPLVMGLLLGSVVAVHGERWNLAAGLLALATLLKVYPLAFAMLLLVVYPRQLGVRLLFALLLVVGLTFLAQDPHYVLEQYRHWARLLASNDVHRRFLPLSAGETYRDLFYLFRLYNVDIPLGVYAIVQGLAGLACAVGCWLGARGGLPSRLVLWRVLMLGSCWVTLCGPATEPRTYILVVPALAWWLVWTYQRGPKPAVLLAGQACGLQLLCVLSSIAPDSVIFFRSAGLHPLSVLLLLASYFTALGRESASSQAVPLATDGEGFSRPVTEAAA